ncbi:hypothetical protein [Bacteroides sp. 41_26]|uniref:hypothetical protein n=1 Tax=Bacteroides sp. 41_26 TaxID=1896973 RepID=UPI00259CB7F5|nr:hypothetical protein [Bacteroides sp. 41_26]
MIRIYADSKAEPVRCTNRRRGIWRITWDYRETETPEGVQRSYMEETFDHRPALAEIKAVINEWYNRQITDTIESGYVWNGLKVWLSMENQMNYKTAYDLAIQTGGENLPVTFKFGTDECPQYRTFEKLEELTDFYTKAMKYIQDTLYEGWRKKDGLDLNLYQ